MALTRIRMHQGRGLQNDDKIYKEKLYNFFTVRYQLMMNYVKVKERMALFPMKMAKEWFRRHSF